MNPEAGSTQANQTVTQANRDSLRFAFSNRLRQGRFLPWNPDSVYVVF